MDLDTSQIIPSYFHHFHLNFVDEISLHLPVHTNYQGKQHNQPKSQALS